MFNCICKKFQTIRKHIICITFSFLFSNKIGFTYNKSIFKITLFFFWFHNKEIFFFNIITITNMNPRSYIIKEMSWSSIFTIIICTAIYVIYNKFTSFFVINKLTTFETTLSSTSKRNISNSSIFILSGHSTMSYKV